jgi:hypothetical protein
MRHLVQKTLGALLGDPVFPARLAFVHPSGLVVERYPRLLPRIAIFHLGDEREWIDHRLAQGDRHLVRLTQANRTGASEEIEPEFTITQALRGSQWLAHGEVSDLRNPGP